MINRLRNTLAEYPPQFWLMATGLLISSAGSSMIWPFLMIYASEKLSLSLSTVSTLIHHQRRDGAACILRCRGSR